MPRQLVENRLTALGVLMSGEDEGDLSLAGRAANDGAFVNLDSLPGPPELPHAPFRWGPR